MPAITRSQTGSLKPRILYSEPSIRVKSVSKQNKIIEEVYSEVSEDDLRDLLYLHSDITHEIPIKFGNPELYQSLETPVKTYCLDIIKYCNEKQDSIYHLDTNTLITIIDGTNLFNSRRNESAGSMDYIYEIPIHIWCQKTGLSRKETEEICDCFKDRYLGKVEIYTTNWMHDTKVVRLWGRY